MSTTNPAASVLDQALHTADELVETLELELEALRARDAEQLHALAATKQTLMQQLKAFDDAHQITAPRDDDSAADSALRERLSSRAGRCPASQCPQRPGYRNLEPFSASYC